MPSTSDLYGQLTGAMGQLKQFQPGNASDFNQAVNAKVGNFANQYKDLGNMDAGMYAAPATQMAGFYNQYGTGENFGLDPMKALSLITQRVGGMQGNRDAYANTITQAGGRMGDIANAALGGYNAQRQGLQDNLGYLQNMYGISNTNDQNGLNRQNALSVAGIQSGAQYARLKWEQDQASLKTPTLNNDGTLTYKDPGLQAQYNQDHQNAVNGVQFNHLKQLNGSTLDLTPENEKQLISIGANKVYSSNPNETIYQLGNDPNNRIILNKPSQTVAPQNNWMQGLGNSYSYARDGAF